MTTNTEPISSSDVASHLNWLQPLTSPEQEAIFLAAQAEALPLFGSGARNYRGFLAGMLLAILNTQGCEQFATASDLVDALVIRLPEPSKQDWWSLLDERGLSKFYDELRTPLVVAHDHAQAQRAAAIKAEAALSDAARFNRNVAHIPSSFRPHPE